MTAIEWHGERLQLRADRALWWPREQTLFVADPHFGKDAAFRVAGIPVPAASGAATVARLERALRETDARRLVVLGDFWHSRAGCTSEVLSELLALRRQFASIEFTLIRGNHDRSAGDPPPELRIECRAEQSLGPFRLLHEPPQPIDDSLSDVEELELTAGCTIGESAFHRITGSPFHPSAVLCGHLHPCAIFSDSGGSARFPCFVFDERVAVLPAFGEFTGMHRVRARSGRRIFVAVESSILELQRQNCAG